ncbi:MAG: sulfurtransferase [Cytophagaceae bacterium SCN 52-12]|nr:MAG: sulfurtransferase [Cytophagaceae bacterium SCN 52-12]
MFDFFKNILVASDNSRLTEAIKEGAFLVDVRSPGEFASGSARGAVNIPLERIASELSRFRGKSNIVVFCRSGNRSGQAMRILEQNGVRDVINGGTWQNVQQCII